MDDGLHILTMGLEMGFIIGKWKNVVDFFCRIVIMGKA